MERLMDRANRERKERILKKIEVTSYVISTLLMIWFIASFIDVNMSRPDIAVWNFFRMF